MNTIVGKIKVYWTTDFLARKSKKDIDLNKDLNYKMLIAQVTISNIDSNTIKRFRFESGPFNINSDSFNIKELEDKFCSHIMNRIQNVSIENISTEPIVLKM